MMLPPSLGGSPLLYAIIRGRHVLIKRDDLLHSSFTGNKARKVAGWYRLLESSSLSSITTLVSHGGVMSNAMLAIAHLAALTKRRFIYHVDRTRHRLSLSPVSNTNLNAALTLGMEIKEEITCPTDSTLMKCYEHDHTVAVIPRGLHGKLAEEGVCMLADELACAWGMGEMNIHEHKAPMVCAVASGTGTTALYLAKSLRSIEPTSSVIAVPCVGDSKYLQQQMKELLIDEYDNNTLPPNLHILDAPRCSSISGRRLRFGKPDIDFLSIWKEVSASTGIEWDLLYAPILWGSLFSDDGRALIEKLHGYKNGAVVVVHSGGCSGNASMLDRYHRLGLLEQ